MLKLFVRTANDNQRSVVVRHQHMNFFYFRCLALKAVLKKQRIKWAEGIKTKNYSRVKCKHLLDLLKAREKRDSQSS